MPPTPLHSISNSPRALFSSLLSPHDSRHKPKPKQLEQDLFAPKPKCTRCLASTIGPCTGCLSKQIVDTYSEARKDDALHGLRLPGPSKSPSSATKSTLGKRKPDFPHDLQTRPTAISKTNHTQTNHTSQTSKAKGTVIIHTTYTNNTKNTSSTVNFPSAAIASPGSTQRFESRCLEYQCHADLVFAVKQSIVRFSAANAPAVPQNRKMTFKGYYSIIEDPKMSFKARAREVMNDLKTITAPMRFTFVSTVKLSSDAEKCTQIWHCQCDQCCPNGWFFPPSVASISTFDPIKAGTVTRIAPVKKATKQSTLAGWVKKPPPPGTSSGVGVTNNTDTDKSTQETKSRCGFCKIVVQVDKSHTLSSGKFGKGVKGIKTIIEFEHPEKSLISQQT